jgi:uncharacterized protein YndB with AHSA1/START domain
MADILHDFPIQAPADKVYAAFTMPGQLDEWWTARSMGQAAVGSEYQLWFGPEYDWRAMVTVAEPGRAFELRMTRSDPDWEGSQVGVRLEPRDGSTMVRFYHRGWKDANEHFRVSNLCWAMYLRVLRRFLEYGERVPYERRLEV